MKEANFGSIGEFSTRCSMDGEPLKSVKDAMLSAFIPYLSEQHARRTDARRSGPRMAEAYLDYGYSIFGSRTERLLRN